jgi:hypothetical protein
MQKLNFQRRAAARSAELFEMCPPKVPWTFGGLWCAPTEYV